MARSLSVNQPSSSVFRLLNRGAAARAIEPTGVMPERRDNATTDLRSLLNQYSYFYAAPSSLSLGVKWFEHGEPGAPRSAPPIFRASSTGKLRLEAAILLAYARAHALPLIVIDVSGTFAQAVRSCGERADLPAPVFEQIEAWFRSVRIVNAGAMRFDCWELFERLLAASPFFRSLQVLSIRKVRSASRMLTELMDSEHFSLAMIGQRPTFDAVWRMISDRSFCDRLYARDGAAATRFVTAVGEVDREQLFRQIWMPLCESFDQSADTVRQPRMSIDAALTSALADGVTATVFDVSDATATEMQHWWSDDLRTVLIRRLHDGVEEVSAGLASQGRRSNAIVAVNS